MAEPSRRFYQTFGLIYQDRKKEQSQLGDCQRGINPAAQLGKEAAKMNPNKPVNPIRDYAFGSVITALILLSPVVAFLMVIAAEMLIDLLTVGGTSAVCAVAAGGIGLVLSRKFWRRPEVVHQSKPELVPGETPIGAAPM
jgi:hypothetical protein